MNHKGIAIPIAFAFLGILSVTVMFLLQTERDNEPMSLSQIRNLQLKYLAKGALQHARVKMKLLSTQAYDGAAYAVGKNPYFDHSAGYDFNLAEPYKMLGSTEVATRSIGGGSIVTNPGPAFFTGTVSGLNPLERANDMYDTDAVATGGLGTMWDGTALGGLAFPGRENELFSGNGAGSGRGHGLLRSHLYLVRFYEDISSMNPFRNIQPRLFDAIDVRQWISNGTVTLGAGTNLSDNDGIYPMSQKAIRIVSGAIDPVTGVPDMFTASYFVEDMNVMAMKGSRLYGEEAIRVQVRVDLVSLDVAAEKRAMYVDVHEQMRENAVYKVSRTLNN